MYKGVGATTTFGAVLLAGFLFQAKPGSRSSSNLQAPALTQSKTKPVTGEGPWLASCKYWSAAQSAEAPVGGTSLDQNVIRHLSGKDVDPHIKSVSALESTCGPGDGWGIPSASNPEISAIIATIPDPIHSHFALDFDRAVDAILLAAADNGYLGSYSWLPWRSNAPALSTSESASNSTPKDEDSTRERQPGLIILRYAPDPNAWSRSAESDESHPERHSFSRSAYYRVIYLFLVGETPALGVNGNQLQNAFKYEKFLKENHGAWLSVRPPPPPDTDQPEAQNRTNVQKGTATTPSYPATRAKTTLSVIGPFFSGSAASLHQGIETAVRDINSTPGEPVQPFISGVTSTLIAVRELDPKSENIYRSFGENASFEQERFLQSLAATGYDLSRVAVLSEAGTVFGSATKITEHACPSGAKDPCKDADPMHPDPNSNRDLFKKGTILNLRFPRELSLLRNAQSGKSTNSDASSSPPTPYLNLSLKDYSADDTVPRFSTGQSPLSIESQLMAIAHQLQRARTQFILLSASNILDDIFLAQFLHRACPDARIVLFAGGDLLFERDVDNHPYIGSISISPYLLTSLDFGNKVQWLHSDYQAEAIYNATSFTFWDHASDTWPKLAGYRRYPVPDPDPHANVPPPVTQFLQIPLWVTAIGADGYYPLAILDWCGSNERGILPTIQPNTADLPLASDRVAEKACDETLSSLPNKTALPPQHVWDYVPESINRNSGISPSLVWMVLDTLILILCLIHIVLLWSAQFWSPATRDLAVDQNDQPHRRSVYLNIGTTVLAAMAFVTAYPLILVGHYYHLALPGHLFAWLTLIAACLACLATILKTWPYRFHKQCVEYCFFNIVAVFALLFTVTLWIAICRSDNFGGEHHSYVGLYFSYRCLQPMSGVCPLLPVLLLLLAWYLWSICQTARLRFSDVHRPRMARIASPSSTYDPANAPYPLFIPDDVLENCSRPIDSCLYKNITCLLITREVILRFCANLTHDSPAAIRSLANQIKTAINPFLAGVYLTLFALCVFASHIHSVDHFLFTPILVPIFSSIASPFSLASGPTFYSLIQSVDRFLFTPTLIPLTFSMHYGPTRYEFLVTALFFPLIMVVLSGWFRTILIWGALSRGLLESLERQPIRFAFTRIKGGSWVSMLNQSGLNIRWRDMSRSTESIRQLVHHPYVKAHPSLQTELLEHYKTINAHIRKLMVSIQYAGASSLAPSVPTAQQSNTSQADLPQSNPASEEAGSQPAVSCLVGAWDRPKPPADDDLCSIYSIEEGYANFCTALLNSVLVPHWDQVRTGLVEECNVPLKDSSKDEKSGEVGKTQKAEDTESSEELNACRSVFIHLAEELIVVRYVALIRAVLVNMRYLMLFVSAAFVLAIIAWNSYPFQPHRLIDWCFTLMFVFIGTGIVWVFAQMHRNPLLSRITDTSPNKLGIDFFIRIAAFGAVPVLTWLAYQFPEIGGNLLRIVQPGLQVMK